MTYENYRKLLVDIAEDTIDPPENGDVEATPYAVIEALKILTLTTDLLESDVPKGYAMRDGVGGMYLTWEVRGPNGEQYERSVTVWIYKSDWMQITNKPPLHCTFMTQPRYGGFSVDNAQEMAEKLAPWLKWLTNGPEPEGAKWKV